MKYRCLSRYKPRLHSTQNMNLAGNISSRSKDPKDTEYFGKLFVTNHQYSLHMGCVWLNSGIPKMKTRLLSPDINCVGGPSYCQNKRVQISILVSNILVFHFWWLLMSQTAWIKKGMKKAMTVLVQYSCHFYANDVYCVLKYTKTIC